MLCIELDPTPAIPKVREDFKTLSAVGGDMKATSPSTDEPFAFELFKNAMHSLADEMVLTICRTSYSSVVKNGMDFSTAICDRDGRLVASGLTQANHLGSVPTAMKAFLRHFD